ncbi:MAG: 16S rRNA (guanine(527)-N(7))-methyltransferase RsmG, partial [Betaproteobacteria bacterium]
MTADTAPDGQRLDDLSVALGLPISAPQRAGLGAYVDLLARWHAAYNLTAVRGREAGWAQHSADCLGVLPARDR